jgi:hypothetical protein
LIQERSVVGTNKYPTRRQMKHDLIVPFCKNKTPKDLDYSYYRKRLAEIEQERLDLE